jgi:hypothetical protein
LALLPAKRTMITSAHFMRYSPIVFLFEVHRNIDSSLIERTGKGCASVKKRFISINYK